MDSIGLNFTKADLHDPALVAGTIHCNFTTVWGMVHFKRKEKKKKETST